MSEQTLRRIISPIFRAAPNASMSVDGWVNAQEARARKVRWTRRYFDGEHDSNLTEELRKALRITSGLQEFNDNRMQVVINTMTDRLRVDDIVADNDAADAWASDLMNQNRFDALQASVHEDDLVDGDTFVMVDYDAESERVRWTHEPAYDGVEGILPVYINHRMVAAIKMWHIVEDVTGKNARTRGDNRSRGDDLLYVNIYWPDRIQKFISRKGAALERRLDADGLWEYPWVDGAGNALGVPLVHFRNRPTTRSDHGLSEIENAIPLQNALNRTLYSLTYSAETSAFRIYVAKGFEPPVGLTPGMIIPISPEAPLDPDEVVDFTAIEGTMPQPYIAQAEHLINAIHEVTLTPRRDDRANANASGEALRQREIMLLGKVQRFQVYTGNGWEDVMSLSTRIQAAFGNSIPTDTRWKTRWKSAEIRDERQIIELAVLLQQTGVISNAATLRIIAPIFDWDDAQLEQIKQEMQSEQAVNFAQLGGSLPGFDSFNPPSFSGGTNLNRREREDNNNG